MQRKAISATRRNSALAGRFEGQSFYPDCSALDRRFHSGSLDFFLILN
jgi:hypothetical protein